ncbi:MAG: agmatinase [Acidobacteria bacterium]|jgi:agmatinase|nr:agmatinase [Acidobacteriota bacterium]
MSAPVDYEQIQPLWFGGSLPVMCDFAQSAAVILPIPLDRTTSYVRGTRNGPRELIMASAQVELWDEELGVDVHPQGIFTMPEMELSHATMEAAIARIHRTASDIMDTDKFLVALGGEHSITPPLVAAAAARHSGLTVLQIDAHADLRDGYLGEHHSHASAMRRSLESAAVVQVGIRNLSQEEAEALPSLNTTIFYDWNMRDDPDWISRVVESLRGPVYITIDLDGLDPSLMPAVGTPEPGGLAWRELTTLLRRTFTERDVVACDVVELCPIAGHWSPNFVAARLVYKLLTYKLGLRSS